MSEKEEYYKDINKYYYEEENEKKEENNYFDEQEKIFFNITTINELYTDTFESYKNGEDIIFDPYIFKNLSRNKFIDWVLNKLN